MSPGQRSAAALVAASAVNLPFGTLYAFSVFLKPIASEPPVLLLRNESLFMAYWASRFYRR